MQEWLFALVAITAFCAAGFITVGIMWLRRLREAIATNLADAAAQQTRTTQRLSETLAQVQKQQRTYEQQLHLLSQANTQLRQGLVSVATRLEHSADTPRGDQTIH